MKIFAIFQKKKIKVCSFAAAIFFALGLGASLTVTACKKAAPLSHYEITAVYEEETHSLSCQMTVQYYNATGQTLPCLAFNVPANAYRKDAKYAPVSAQKRAAAYQNGESYGGVEVTACTVQGQSANYVLGGKDATFLTVETGEIAPQKSKKVTVNFTLSLANVWHRTGYTDQTVNLGNWFPILAVWENGSFQECVYEDKGDPFYSEVANFSVRLTLPEKYVVAASGAGDFRRENGLSHYDFSLKNARDFAIAFSSEFSLISQTVNGVEVRYYYLQDAFPEKTLSAAAESLACYFSRFGAYAYKTLTVAEVGFIEGGMEYPALVFLSSSLKAEERARVTAHEVAHQWWYAAVGSDQTARGWLDESLAEYSTAIFFEDYPLYGVDRRDLYNAAHTSYRLYTDVYSQLTGKTSGAMLRPLSEFLSEYEYVNLVYNKGFLLWETYRTSVGDQRFFRALSHFYTHNRYGVVTEQNLFASLTKSGAGGCGLVQSFLDGSAVI